MRDFWHNLKKPIIGLSPMDGVTDAPFRAVTDEVGHPDVLYTEFVSAEGFARHPEKLAIHFATHPTDTPLVIQFFTSKPDELEKAIVALKDMHISGIDINMGCPNNHVVHHGGGAALIRKPALALKLIETAKKTVREMGKSWPISVKTRIGFDSVMTKEWISSLLEANPSVITLHGRTLKQMYSGLADWSEIAKASELARQTETLLLGNGDIHSYAEAKEKAKKYSPDGVLIGRGACGNPWVFSDHEPTHTERIQTAIFHCEQYEAFFGSSYILPLRKHLAWYVKGFPGASDIRAKLVRIETIDEAKELLTTLLV